MKKGELDRVLADHALYWKTDGEEGETASLGGVDLSGADLDGANLDNAELCGANLSSADLYRATLRNADLSGAALRHADLVATNLRDADLRYTDLRAADLRGANLRGADLRGSNLQDADLRGADLRHASLSLANLNGAKIDLAIEHRLLRGVALEILYGGEVGAYDSQAWHDPCNTDHCIAIRAALMAKDRELEGQYGTEVAGLLLLGVEAHSHFLDNRKASLKWLEEIAKRPVTSA